MKFYVFIACSLSSLPNNLDSSLYVNYFVRDMNSTFLGFLFGFDSILYFSEFTDFRREGGGKN